MENGSGVKAPVVLHVIILWSGDSAWSSAVTFSGRVPVLYSVLRVSRFQFQLFGFCPQRRFLPNAHPVLGPAETCIHMQERRQRKVSNINAFSPPGFDALNRYLLFSFKVAELINTCHKGPLLFRRRGVKQWPTLWWSMRILPGSRQELQEAGV